MRDRGSLMGLTFDVGLRGLALVVEVVEVLLQTGVGGDTRVDGAAKGDLALVPLHRWTSWTDRTCRENSLGSERMSLRGSTWRAMDPPSQLCRRADSLGD